MGTFSGQMVGLRARRGAAREMITALEPRTMLYAVSGLEWAITDISYSFMPDGTNFEGHGSALFAMLDGRYGSANWQREFARALQTWANVSPLNIHQVPDDGSPVGTFGPVQGNTRFGDMRYGSRSMSTSIVGYAHFPNTNTNGSTEGGDIALNAARTYYLGANPDVFSVILHEAGHGLGVDHSSSGTVMYGGYSGVLSGLTADDIAAIQAIYGVRQADAYDAVGANNSLLSATALSIGATGTTLRADLTSHADADYYRLVVPAGVTGGTFAVDASALSLLAPKVTVYDAAGNVVASASADYGRTASVSLNGLAAGQVLTVVADGATADVFGMGAYRLNVSFADAPLIAAPAAPSGVSAIAMSASRVDLSWTDQSTNEDGFQVLRSTDGVQFASAGLVGRNATSFSDTTVSPGTTYYYRIVAFNLAGNSPASATATATTPQLLSMPAAPSGLAATPATSTRVDLRWNDNSTNEDAFWVFRSSGGSPYTRVAVLGAGVTAWSDTSVSGGNAYAYFVQASNAAGTSAASAPVSVTTPAPLTVPAAPGSLTATPLGKGKIALSWLDLASNENGYVVERYDGKSWSQVKLLGANATSATDNARRGKTYVYRVYAFNDAGNSAYSNSVSVTA